MIEKSKLELKKAEVIAMRRKGYSIREITEAVGVSKSSVIKWTKEAREKPANTDLSKHIERKLTDLEYKIAERTAEQLFKRVNDDKKIDKAKLSEITNTYKTIRELQGKGNIGNQINIQINQNGDSFTIESNND